MPSVYHSRFMDKDKFKIYKMLFSHSIKSMHRSSFFLKKLSSKIVLSILFIYILGIVVFFCLNLDLVVSFYSDMEVDQLVKYSLLSFISINLILHLIFSKIYAFNLVPYLILRIKKKNLISFILMQSKFNVVNLISFILIGIIFVKYMWDDGYNPVLALININLIFSINNSFAIFTKIVFESYYFIRSLTVISLVIVLAFLITCHTSFPIISYNAFQYIFEKNLFFVLVFSTILNLVHYMNKVIIHKKLRKL